MKRVHFAVVSILAAVVAAGGAVAAPAQAQVGYPPGPCTVMVGTSALGTLTVGAVVDITLAPMCTWTPGAPVAVTVNGQIVATKAATATGSVSINLTVLSATTLSIDDPILVPAVCGQNTVTGLGSSLVANGMVTQAVTFNVDCASVANQAASRGFLSFTGANVLRWTGIALGLVMFGAFFVASSRKRAKTAERDLAVKH